MTHLKDTYLFAQYHRFAKRLGKAKAVTAASHRVLVIVSHVLQDQKPYQDLGADDCDRLDTRRFANHSVKRLEAPGFQVTLQPQEEVSVSSLSFLRYACVDKRRGSFPLLFLVQFFIFRRNALLIDAKCHAYTQTRRVQRLFLFG